MGMFNYVDYKTKCPACGAEVNEFQTKDGDVFMRTVSYLTVNNFYGECDKCGYWIEFTRKPAKSIDDFERVSKNGN
jgi:hypothetical protein